MVIKTDKKKNKVLIIIPAYNEEKNIERVIEEIKRDVNFADILIVNDCSKDRTLEILNRMNDITYISLPVNLGYSGALQTGFKYAVEQDYELVVQFDGDGQHIASEIKVLVDYMLKTKADIVIGSRYLTGNDYKNSYFREAGSRFFSFVIKKLCKQNITDPTSGFQILSRKVFTMYSKINQYPEYPDANLIIEMLRKNYRIHECPVKMRSREYGESMHSGYLKPMKYMIKTIYAIALLLLLLRGKNIKLNQQT